MAHASKKPQAPFIRASRDPATLGGHERVGEILGVGVVAEQLPSEDWMHARVGWVCCFSS